MAGNTIGQLFRVTTYGESHGPAIGGVVDGCPPGLPLNEADIQVDLDRRRPGRNRYTTQRQEADQVKILSGVFSGVTTGAPIGLLIYNSGQKAKDYEDLKNKFRPGHADYTYQKKYGIRDYRGGGRSSARETAVRVAAGSIAKRYLRRQCGIKIRAYVAQVGAIPCDDRVQWESVESNPFFCPDPDRVAELQSYIERLRREGDSVGARLRVEAQGLMAGLGEPVFDRLDAALAHAMMSINAVKAVGIGDGFACVEQRGSEHRDEMTPSGFVSNHAGGVLGGISSGQDLVVDVAFKPTSSIRVPGKTVDEQGRAVILSVQGRHDPCVGLRAVPIVEAMMAIVLLDHLLRQRAQCSTTDTD